MKIELLIEPEDVLTTEMNEICGGINESSTIVCKGDGIVNLNENAKIEVAIF